MENIRTVVPIQCQYYKNEKAAANASKADMILIKEYPVRQQLDSDDCMRSLLSCKECGQLYFYEFIEWIDWEKGNDPQHRSYIPVPDEEAADHLDTLNSFEILVARPSLRIDFSEVMSIKWYV